jgi:hypothetical protein
VAGHELRGIAGEEDRGADELARQAEAWPQHPGLDEVGGERGPLRRLARERRIHERRPDAVHPHAPVTPLERHRPRDPQHAALGREVGARPGVGDERADRSKVDDAALALGEHLAPEGLAGEIGALQVEVEDEVELVLGEVLDR